MSLSFSGFPYYVDLETGSSTWDIPAPFQYEWEIPFRIVCVQCDTLVATNHCMECELSYCDACFVSSHGKGVMRRHRYVYLLTAHALVGKFDLLDIGTCR